MSERHSQILESFSKAERVLVGLWMACQSKCSFSPCCFFLTERDNTYMPLKHSSPFNSSLMTLWLLSAYSLITLWLLSDYSWLLPDYPKLKPPTEHSSLELHPQVEWFLLCRLSAPELMIIACRFTRCSLIARGTARTYNWPSSAGSPKPKKILLGRRVHQSNFL